MPVKKTQDQVINDFTKAHAARYGYSEVRYVGDGEKVQILCYEHGYFWQTPELHKKGANCPKCAAKYHTNSRTKTTEEVKQELSALFPNKFDLSKVNYKNSKDKIEISCVVCRHSWKTIFHLLKKGHGCPACAFIKTTNLKRKPQDKFIGECRVAHGNTIDFSKVNYIDLKNKVELVCNSCGNNWWSLPSNVLRGVGCPACASWGFKSNDPAILYILEDKELLKIGITQQKGGRRIRQINNSSGLSFKLTNQFHFKVGKDAYDIEQTMIKELRKSYKQPKTVFDGSTECFLDVDKEHLINRIEELIKGNTK